MVFIYICRMIDRFIYGELLEIVGEFPVLGIVGPRDKLPGLEFGGGPF